MIGYSLDPSSFVRQSLVDRNYLQPSTQGMPDYFATGRPASAKHRYPFITQF